VDLALGIQQFQEIARGYLGQRAALGGQNDRRPPDGRVPRSDWGAPGELACWTVCSEQGPTVSVGLGC
jgi:hypothetical protein